MEIIANWAEIENLFKESSKVKIFMWMGVVLLVVGASQMVFGQTHKRESRLSSSVAIVSEGPEIEPWLKQPVPSPVIDLGKYQQGRWYLEREEAIFSTKKAPFAHSEEYVGVADASID